MSLGAIQLVAISFSMADRDSDMIRRELESLDGRGLFRVIDMLAITKRPDGAIAPLKEFRLSTHEQTDGGHILSLLIGMTPGNAMMTADASAIGEDWLAHHDFGLGQDDVEAIVRDLTPDTRAVLLLIEHTWALRLEEALASAGGWLIAHGFLAPKVLLSLGRELSVVVEAEAATVLAHVLTGAALIDTLESVADAELEAARAGAEGSATDHDAAALKVATTVAVLRALIVAGLIDEAFAEEAVDVLVAAGISPVATAEHAAQLAAQRANATEAATAMIETGVERRYEQ
jgi:hypothetical protein